MAQGGDGVPRRERRPVRERGPAQGEHPVRAVRHPPAFGKAGGGAGLLVVRDQGVEDVARHRVVRRVAEQMRVHRRVRRGQPDLQSARRPRRPGPPGQDGQAQGGSAERATGHREQGHGSVRIAIAKVPPSPRVGMSSPRRRPRAALMWNAGRITWSSSAAAAGRRHRCRRACRRSSGNGPARCPRRSTPGPAPSGRHKARSTPVWGPRCRGGAGLPRRGLWRRTGVARFTADVSDAGAAGGPCRPWWGTCAKPSGSVDWTLHDLPGSLDGSRAPFASWRQQFVGPTRRHARPGRQGKF